MDFLVLVNFQSGNSNDDSMTPHTHPSLFGCGSMYICTCHMTDLFQQLNTILICLQKFCIYIFVGKEAPWWRDKNWHFVIHFLFPSREKRRHRGLDKHKQKFIVLTCYMTRENSRIIVIYFRFRDIKERYTRKRTCSFVQECTRNRSNGSNLICIN